VPFTPRRAAFLADWAFLVAAGGVREEGSIHSLVAIFEREKMKNSDKERKENSVRLGGLT
jgi:hypothetical protein